MTCHLRNIELWNERINLKAWDWYRIILDSELFRTPDANNGLLAFGTCSNYYNVMYPKFFNQLHKNDMYKNLI